MRLIIGDYDQGKRTPGFHESGDEVSPELLQELKGRFAKEYREANITLTQRQLLAAATPDQDIIQAIHALENLDVVLNSMGKYATEWHELHHPDQDTPWPQLAGQGNSGEPGLRAYNDAVRGLVQTRERVLEHIETRMHEALPNTTAVAGSVIGAKLLAAAGGLERLARFPATTVQLLGAEQALFRHLRQRAYPPPKHGILFNHPFVQDVRRRGKMARAIANAISIAAKVDYYRGEPVGERLRAKVEVQHRALARP